MLDILFAFDTSNVRVTRLRDSSAESLIMVQETKKNHKARRFPASSLH